MSFKSYQHMVVVFALSMAPALASAQPTPTTTTIEGSTPTVGDPAAAPEGDPAQQFEASLRYQTGDIAIGSGLARIHLGEEFRYLDSSQTNRVLQAWGNPANANTLGMVVATGMTVTQEDSWAVILTSMDDGHVNDDDANDINFDEVLEEMKRDSREASARRVQAGLSPLTLEGWAERPHYDRGAHLLYWAKDLSSGQGEHTLNYAVRVLGRTNVLELNAVASMRQLSSIRGPMETLRQRITFEQGRRYTDFVPSADRVAAYGIGALVAGKIIAKAGLFKVLLGLLIAGKKLVVAAFVGIAAAARSWFGKKDQGAVAPSETASSDNSASPPDDAAK
jgi:uncharacterized membrane-anchored protein